MSQLVLTTAPVIERNLPPIQISKNNKYILYLPIQNVEYSGIKSKSGFGVCIKIAGANGNSSKVAYFYYWLMEQDKTDIGYKIEFDPEMLIAGYDYASNWIQNAENERKDSMGIGTITSIVNTLISLVSIYPRDKLYYRISAAYWTLDVGASSADMVFSPWSTYGITKCINESNYKIKFNVSKNQKVADEYKFQITYTNSADAGERETEYIATLLEASKSSSTYSAVYTTGKKIHNSSSDIIYRGELTCADSVIFPILLDNTKEYKIEYTLFTNSGYSKTKQSDPFQAPITSVPKNEVKLFVENKMHDGYVSINLKSLSNNIISLSGRFLLLRASEEDNYKIWHRLQKIAIYEQILPREIYKDYYAAQGITYKYAIIQCINDTWDPTIEKIISEPVMADFEHLYLSDAEHILTIKFNPKVSTFKTTKLEGKVDTIGGKYPVFIRNGDTNYKQFAISGLISTLMDDQHLFGYHDDIYSWNLDGENLKRERIFKLAVEEWLNNGKPKFLRSATEGNYIIILQGVGLSPEDKLGRLLHNFSATGYEYDDYNLDNLIKYNLIKTSSDKILKLYSQILEAKNLPNTDTVYSIRAKKINFKNLEQGKTLEIKKVNNSNYTNYYNGNLKDLSLMYDYYVSIKLNSNNFGINGQVEIISDQDSSILNPSSINTSPSIKTKILVQKKSDDTTPYTSITTTGRLVSFMRICFWRKDNDPNKIYKVKLNDTIIDIDGMEYALNKEQLAGIWTIEIGNGINADFSYQYI